MIAGLLLVWTISGLSAPESAVYDDNTAAVYVSNAGGGFITKADASGKVLKLKWVAGLSAPKGMVLCRGRLFAADGDRIAVIDPGRAKVERLVPVPGARALEDLAADPQCSIYASDPAAGALYRYSEGRVVLWMQGPQLEAPNALFWLSGKLIVASKRLIAYDPKTQATAMVPGPMGSLDGLERFGKGWLVTDRDAGTLLRSTAGGEIKVLMAGLQGPADIASVPSRDLFLLPERDAGRLRAYKLSRLAP